MKVLFLFMEEGFHEEWKRKKGTLFVKFLR